MFIIVIIILDTGTLTKDTISTILEAVSGSAPPSHIYRIAQSLVHLPRSLQALRATRRPPAWLSRPCTSRPSWLNGVMDPVFSVSGPDL